MRVSIFFHYHFGVLFAVYYLLWFLILYMLPVCLRVFDSVVLFPASSPVQGQLFEQLFDVCYFHSVTLIRLIEMSQTSRCLPDNLVSQAITEIPLSALVKITIF